MKENTTLKIYSLYAPDDMYHEDDTLNGFSQPNFGNQWQFSTWRPATLLAQSFAGINFRGDKLSRTLRPKIKFREYKLSRMKDILAKFSYFRAIFYTFFDRKFLPIK